MTYNTTFSTPLPTPDKILSKAHEFTNGTFIPFMLLTIYAGGAYITLRQTRSASNALMIPGTVVTIITIILMGMELINETYFLISLVLTLSGLLLRFFDT
jgi:cytochrome c biogenesis factor